MLTTLPKKLKERFPHLRIRTYPRAFNPVVFKNNPSVNGISYLPDALYGDDCNWGSGHLIQLKEIYFDVPISEKPKPTIVLSEKEKKEHLLERRNPYLPLCVVHPWGKTFSQVADAPFWNKLLQTWKGKVEFCQIGIEGQEKLADSDHVSLFGKNPWHARKLFSLLNQADFFIGVNSGPMHVARAFDVPSLILTFGEEPEKIFERRRNHPYFLYRNCFHGFLYEDNAHIDCAGKESKSVLSKVNEIVEKYIGSHRNEFKAK